MCHMVDRILDSVDESQFLNTLISEISVDNKGSGLTLRLVTGSERMRYNIDFNKKKHLIPVITGDNVPAIIKLYNQETSYDGDSYDNEVKGYVKAMENNIPTPRLICFGVLESGVEYIVSEYIPGETLNETYSFIDNAIELLENYISELEYCMVILTCVTLLLVIIIKFIFVILQDVNQIQQRDVYTLKKLMN